MIQKNGVANRFFHWNQIADAPHRVDRAGERHRHLGVGADAEGLPDHDPWAEIAAAEEVVAGAPHAQPTATPMAVMTMK